MFLSKISLGIKIMLVYPMQFGDVYTKFGKLKRMLLMAGNYQLATLIDKNTEYFPWIERPHSVIC